MSELRDKTWNIILNRLHEKYPDSRDAEFAVKKLAELDNKTGRKNERT